MKFFRKIQEFFSGSVSYYADGLGGTALPDNSLMYVEREIDNQVYQFLRFRNESKIACYIFGSPQTGKSSLALRLSKILEHENNICILVSIQSPINSLYTKDFYLLFVNQIYKRFKQETEQLYSDLPPDATNQQRVELLANDIESLIYHTAKYLYGRGLLLFVDGIDKLSINCLKDFINLIEKINNQSLKYISFTLFGELHPENFLAISKSVSQTTETFQINLFSGECKSLLEGINLTMSNKYLLLENVLLYTHGHPFLTIYLLHLSAKYIDKDRNDFKSLVKKIVQEEIVSNNDGNLLLKQHFQRVSDFFARGDPQTSKQKLYALEAYKKLFDHSKFYAYNRVSPTHKILIESGLASKIQSHISITNLIYEKVFDLALIETLQKNINLGENEMTRTNYSITNRDFYFLIDCSASMKDSVSIKDTRRRFDSIRESVKGHIDDVLNYNEDGKNICDECELAFFNAPKVSKKRFKLLDNGSIDEKFTSINPSGDTNIAPTFKALMSEWQKDRGTKDGAVVIYVDGLIDDRVEFINEIRKVASQLEHQSHLPILIVGIGDAINSPITIKWYFDLDLNGPSFKDANNETCDLVIFNRMDDVNEIGGVIQAIKEQLTPNPNEGLPEWLSDEFPALYQELKEKYDDF